MQNVLCASVGGQGDPVGAVQGWKAIRTFYEQNTILCVSVEPGIRGEDSGQWASESQFASGPSSSCCPACPSPPVRQALAAYGHPTHPAWAQAYRTACCMERTGKKQHIFNLQTTLTWTLNSYQIWKVKNCFGAGGGRGLEG